MTVRENICTPNIELLSVSLRPFYLPREFPQIFITVVYIHPKANNVIASNTVSDVVQGLQNISPEAPNFILGDFNHVSLKKTLPNFYQYITCPTRQHKTLDLCYGNIKGAYKSVTLSALVSADHNCVQLLPIYRPLFKREKPQIREVKIWSEDSTARLQGCFDCTDWEVFKDSCEHIDELTDVVCSYITFCENMIVPTRKFKVFSNTKPWMSKSVKSSLLYKQLAYRQGDRLERVTARKEVRTEIFKAKQAYKVKLEKNLADNNLGSAWSGMKKIAGIHHNVNKSTACIDGFRSNDDFSNALNMFYSRFESFDFKNEVEELRCLCKDDCHIVLEQAAVEKMFLTTKVNKSPGPDHICGRILKHCAKQLTSIFSDIFNWSLRVQKVPNLWKKSIIIPVPKCNKPKVFNDLRPVALTSLVMKSFEKLVKSELLSKTGQVLDPLQFAYRVNRSVEDASLMLLNLLTKHLEGKNTHARLLFIDFASAFNTIQPHILARRLLEYFKLNHNVVGWLLDFLTNRTQRVKVNGSFSDVLCLSTGSPQGCVLSPLLYILYTNMCQSLHENRIFIKFADDTVIVSLLQGDESGHGPVVEDFVTWCDDSYLKLNITKTKDMIIDFRTRPVDHVTTIIKGEAVDQVENFKYLGIVIDSKLSFELNCEMVCKKSQQRLSCLRKLAKFHVERRMLTLFYSAFIESVLSFSIGVWYGSLSVKNKNSLNQIVRWASRIIGVNQKNLGSIYTNQLYRKASTVLSDLSHPLRIDFKLLPSGCRFAASRWKTRRYRNTFVPAAI